MFLLLLLCLLLVSPQVALAQSAAGTYTWYWASPGQSLGEHGTVELRGDGTASWSGGKNGKWTQTGSRIIIDWGGGRDTLSVNGTSLSGSNEVGWTVQGRRPGGGVSNEAVLGSWRWHWAAPGEAMTEHGVLTFNGDGTMNWSGGKSGRWSRASRTQYRLDWNDGGSDSMNLVDGNLMQGSNQAGWRVEGRRD